MTLHCLASVPRALNAKPTYREATVRNRLLLLSLFNLPTTRKLPKSSKLSFTTHYHVFLLKWSQCVASGYNSLI